MKKFKFVYLVVGLIALLLELYDIFSQEFSFSITNIFILVVIEIVGLSLFSYVHQETVKNKKRFLDIMQVVVCIIYLINLGYALYFNPSLRHIDNMAYSINLIPFKTISLYITSAMNNTLPIKTIILNLIGNSVLFIPFGYFLYVFFKDCRHLGFYMFVVVVTFSFVELIQVYFNVGTGDVDDIILNSVGALLFFITTYIKPIRNVLKKMEVR